MSIVSALFSKGGSLSELKQRLIFVAVGILVYRLGAYIPVPGIDPVKLANFFHGQQNTILGMFNMFSGGALSRLSIFALGIMPYISASIIFQLLGAVSPSLKELKKDGEAGRRKMNQYTRYLTVCLAIFQSLGVSKFMVHEGVVYAANIQFYFVSSLTLTTGAVFLMWLGEQMTERGVGNGISLLIFTSIISGVPLAIMHTFEQARQGNLSLIALLMVGVVILAVTLFVVFVERAQRRITVNYAKRQQGRKMAAPQQSHLPLKINMAGVIPPIFASSILLFPSTMSTWFGSVPGFEWLSQIGLALSFGQPLYIILFAAAVSFFCFFYTSLVFNPRETADNLRNNGAFIPGIRPGQQTASFIDKVMSRLTLVGAVYITLVSLLPMFLMKAWNVPFYFGGTSLLIAVVVLMDFMSQVQAHLMSTRYDGLLKKTKLKGGGNGGLGGVF